MFESGINITFGEMNVQIENGIYQAVRNVGIDIDKEKLLQVIKDARKFYDDGVSDGRMRARNELVRCHECEHRGNPRKCILAFVADLKHQPFFVLDNHGEWYCADAKQKESEHENP